MSGPGRYCCRQGGVLFALLFIFLSTALAAPKVQLSGEVELDISGLVAELEDWLDENVDYPRRETRPIVRLIDAEVAARLAGRQSPAFAAAPSGLYDPETQVISLVRPWAAENPLDVSVLLHELVHHRQASVGHWYCPGAMELPAYKIQQVWLGELELEADINWVAVVLEAGCSPRDIHPN